MSHTSPDDFTGKTHDKKLQIMMKNTRRKVRKFKKVLKVLIIMKPQILCMMIALSIQRNEIIDLTVEDHEFQISCNTFCDRYCFFV